LSEAVGNLDQAVAYRVDALVVWLQIGTATTGDVRPLAGLRRQLGRDRFRAAAVASGLDEQSASNLMELLDQHEKPGDGNLPAAGLLPDRACRYDHAPQLTSPCTTPVMSM
jgi:hypothetical protein